MSISYRPEDYGLRTLGAVEWSEPSYSFDTTEVWIDGEGKLYWASDSGCSCPSPFENYHELSQLETGDEFELAKYLDEQAEVHDYYGQEPGWDSYFRGQVVDLLARVRAA